MLSDQEIRYKTVEGIAAEHQIKLQYCIRCTGKTYMECDHNLCEKRCNYVDKQKEVSGNAGQDRCSGQDIGDLPQG
jgi:hypothetical protein